MRVALVTGFGPFRDVVDNPSGALARALDGARVAGLRVAGVELPVTYAAAAERPARLLAEHRPAVVLALGQGRPGAVRVERVARNRVGSTEPDVAGVAPTGAPLVPGAPEALACRWDADALCAALAAAGLPAEPSDDAGGYVCNALFYHLLSALPPGTPAGFVHVPPLSPDLGLDRLRAGLERLLAAAAPPPRVAARRPARKKS